MEDENELRIRRITSQQLIRPIILSSSLKSESLFKELEMEGPKVEEGALESSLIQIIQEHQQRAVHIQDQAGTKACMAPILWLSSPSHPQYHDISLSSCVLTYGRVPNDKAKKDALRTAVQVSELLVDTINGGVEEAFTTEKHIEVEIRSLINTIIRYKKQTNHWLAASHAMNSVLKEIGDFENWMKTMDLDCKSINAVIRNIHQA